MRFLLVLCALACVVVADELSNRAVIQDAFDQLNKAAPEPDYDSGLIPSIVKCMEPDNTLASDLCFKFIQLHNDFLVAKYRRRKATDLVVKLLAQMPQLQTIQTEERAF